MPKSTAQKTLNRPSAATSEADPSHAQARAAEVGESLAKAFRELIESFPSEARTVSQMSRWLGIMRPNCQRIALGLRASEDPLELLQRFPGVRGLMQFVSAASNQGSSAKLIASAKRAITMYAELINDFGGTQSRLTAQLGRVTGTNAANGSADVDNPDRLPEIGFDFASATAGYHCSTRLEIALVRVMPSDASKLEVVIGSGLLGALRKPNGMPICRMHRSIGQQPNVGRTASLDGQQAYGFMPNALIPHFSSQNVPCVSRKHGEDWTIEVFNEDGGGDAVDLVIANHHAPATEHPKSTSAKIYNRGVLVGVPARNLIMDVYMERQLAMASVISSGVYFTGMVGGVGHNRPESRWFDRLPQEPTIEHLGLGLRKSATKAHARHAELTAYLFQGIGWNPEQFIGYRCQVAYPTWGTEYLMTFDFSEP